MEQSPLNGHTNDSSTSDNNACITILSYKLHNISIFFLMTHLFILLMIKKEAVAKCFLKKSILWQPSFLEQIKSRRKRINKEALLPFMPIANRGSLFPNKKVYLYLSGCFGNMQVSSTATTLNFVVEFV
ncbi:hypothetical protein SAMN04490355_10581 [Pelosinus propionicus DSM 13327]|uniref:Uncharacterized protein n=1 Tax=Pelosinus propionicus DSM 13327 TaxID=1123291 RepID=A0A1I4P5E8_9FIRM|nr:hypothetical protein SAMN04490355_10581 [Pelosinus propionicus DSM 13327]